MRVARGGSNPRSAGTEFLPEPILNFIAQNITKNIRRLEGALLKVSSYSALTGKSVAEAIVRTCSIICSRLIVLSRCPSENA